MLTKKEENRIKAYCVLPKVAILSLILAGASCLVWGILMLIDYVVFGSHHFYTAGLVWLFILSGGFLLLALVAATILSVGMRSHAWHEIVEGAKVIQQENYDEDMLATTADHRHPMSGAKNGYETDLGMKYPFAVQAPSRQEGKKISELMNRKASLVADIYGMETRPLLRPTYLLCLIPLFLILIFLPEFQNSRTQKEQVIACTTAAIEEIQSALNHVCKRVEADDPSLKYNQEEFYAYGYMEDATKPFDAHITIILNREGVITSVMYSCDIDIELTTDANIYRANTYWNLMREGLKRGHHQLAHADLLESCQLPTGFTRNFVKDGYFTPNDISLQQNGMKIQAHLDTMTLENYNENRRLFMTLKYQ